jgi:hypothetical protein
MCISSTNEVEATVGTALRAQLGGGAMLNDFQYCSFVTISDSVLDKFGA